MAAISITSPVVPGNLKDIRTGQAGVAITSGQTLYRDATAGNKLKLADADAEATAQAVGIAVCDAGINELVSYATNGNTVTQVGTTFTVGVAYFLGPTAGGISPEADVLSGDYKTYIGVATTTSALKVHIHIGGVAETA